MWRTDPDLEFYDAIHRKDLISERGSVRPTAVLERPWKAKTFDPKAVWVVQEERAMKKKTWRCGKPSREGDQYSFSQPVTPVTAEESATPLPLTNGFDYSPGR